jgi:LmbE family N-acetylglucosaminyl deacetylase
VHAHPDDIETLSSGALALLSGLGHTVQIATATAGEGGAVDQAPDEVARIRKGEAAAAAAMIGASYACLGLPDLGVFNEDAQRRAMTGLVRRAGADIVITASPTDYHPDHEAVSVLARDACFASTVRNYATPGAEPLAAIPHLYFMDPIGGRSRDGVRVRPDFGVDVGATMDVKRRMMLAHESQQAWVAKQHGIGEFVRSMEAWAERRGRDFGVAYAEGFRQYRHHPYPRSPVLQALLSDVLLELKDWPG